MTCAGAHETEQKHIDVECLVDGESKFVEDGDVSLLHVCTCAPVCVLCVCAPVCVCVCV